MSRSASHWDNSSEVLRASALFGFTTMPTDLISFADMLVNIQSIELKLQGHKLHPNTDSFESTVLYQIAVFTARALDLQTLFARIAVCPFRKILI